MQIKFHKLRVPHIAEPFIGDEGLEWVDDWLAFNLQGYKETKGWNLEKTVAEITKDNEFWFIVDGERKSGGFMTEWVKIETKHPRYNDTVVLYVRVENGKVTRSMAALHNDWVQARSDIHLFIKDWVK